MNSIYKQKKKTIKKIATVTMIATVAVTAGWNFYQNTQEVAMNELGLANVEALASGESGTSTCYHTITSKESSRILYCGTCTYIDGTDSPISGKGKC